MTEIARQNFSRRKPDHDGKGAAVPWPIDEAELTRFGPPPYRFVRCNLVNRSVPEGSEVVECNTCLREPDVFPEDAKTPRQRQAAIREKRVTRRTIHGRIVAGQLVSAADEKAARDAKGSVNLAAGRVLPGKLDGGPSGTPKGGA